MNTPRISLITVCFNDLPELKKTVNSILSQKKIQNLEYMVIDGGSTDGTNDYLWSAEKEMNAILPFRYISEKDLGIYDAMNKGLKMSCGEWVSFINAGDVYHDAYVLNHISETMGSTHADVLYGNALKYNKWMRQVVVPPKLDHLRQEMILCHQAIFFKRNVHLNYLYDLKYKIVADYNSVLQMYLDGKKFEYKDITIVDYNMDGVSADDIVATFMQIHAVKKDNGVYTDSAKNRLLYHYGVVKRKILKRLPQSVRWKIVKVKRIFMKGEALY